MWLEVKEGGVWTMHLMEDLERFHDDPPEAETALLSFDVSPEKGAHMETMAFYFNEVRYDEATLRMHWGDTFVPFQIEVADHGRLSMTWGEFEFFPLPVGLHRFYDADYRDGRLFEVGVENPCTFKVEDSVVAGFVVQLDNGWTGVTGKRVD